MGYLLVFGVGVVTGIAYKAYLHPRLVVKINDWLARLGAP